jgi:hypothetical protein
MLILESIRWEVWLPLFGCLILMRFTTTYFIDSKTIETEKLTDTV